MVREIMSKARRAMILSGVEIDKKAPATKPVIEKLIATCDGSLVGKRDRALILVAFSSGGRRRSELANFRVVDVEKLSDGRFQLQMYHSKSDYSGKPKLFPAVGQAGIALQDYLESSGITAGPLFRNIGKHGSILDGLSAIGIQHVFKKRCKIKGKKGVKKRGSSLPLP